MENIYYTYAYLREDKTPYYIGKGKGNRMYHKGKTTKPPKDKSRIIFLKKNLTEEEAFKHEIYMIDVFGRKDLGTGILHNRTNGGEGSSGYIHSEERKIKISGAMKGRTCSKKHRERVSEAKRNQSEKTRIKISEALKNNTNSLGRKDSEEVKIKKSESHKGEKNPMFGKSHSEETKMKMSKVKKGRKWWNDGCGNSKWVVECPGDGWKLGRK
jgi:hypothetical protein